VRPVIRIVAIVAVVVLLPVAAYSLWDYLALQRLIAEIEAIQARGEPLNDPLVARDFENLPDEQRRAGDYYLAAAVLAQHTAAAVPVGSVHLWLAGVDTQAQRGALAEGLRVVVDGAPEALALADKAAGLPFGGLPPVLDLGGRMSGLHRLSVLIAARTLALSLAGRGDEAVDSALVAIAERRAWQDLRWIPPSDVEVPAILSLSTPSAAALQRLDAALAAAVPTPDPAQQLLALRAEFLAQSWRRYYGADPSLPRMYTLPMRSLEETIVRPIISQRLARSLETWAAMIPPARLSAGRLAALEAIARAQGGTIPPELGAAVVRTRAYTGSVALERCTRTLVALERFRRDRGGALPASLAELVPRYLPAVPIDPMIDAPLHYRVQADAYVVYSVGLDQRDDGGDLTSEVRRETRPDWAARNLRGRDLGQRVVIH